MALFPDEFVIGFALLTIVVGVCLLLAQARRSGQEDRNGPDEGLKQ